MNAPREETFGRNRNKLGPLARMCIYPPYMSEGDGGEMKAM